MTGAVDRARKTAGDLANESVGSGSAPPVAAKKGNRALSVASVQKAFRVLAAFDDARPTLSLTQLAFAAQLDKSAAQRFAHTLVELGLLAKDPITKCFEPTSRTLEFGYRFLKSNNVVRRAAPYLLHLSQETGETVNLTALVDTKVLYLSRFQSRHVLATDVVVGTSLPAYCTATGIAILSKLPDAEVASILDRSELRPLTPHTIWKRSDLLEKIARTRVAGYACSWNETYMGDLSIAAAINGPRQRPVGAISISVSAARYAQEEAEEKFSSLVVASARALD
jgi:DNA-binding IclR family transcriptional regulator